MAPFRDYPQSESMKALSIPAKLLVSPVRDKVWIVKLSSTKGNKILTQRAVKGCTIAFPQENAFKTSTLPGSISDLSEHLQIIFTGNGEPTENQMKKIFAVPFELIKTVLIEFKSNGHPAFQQGSWDITNMNELERISNSDQTMCDILDDCIDHLTYGAEKTVSDLTSSYTGSSSHEDFDLPTPVFTPSKNDHVWYIPDLCRVKIIDVHSDISPPYYDIEFMNGRQKQTILSKLQPLPFQDPLMDDDEGLINCVSVILHNSF